jgi:hypothetical protein
MNSKSKAATVSWWNNFIRTYWQIFAGVTLATMTSFNLAKESHQIVLTLCLFE